MRDSTKIKRFKTNTPKGVSESLPKMETIKARNSNLPGGKLGFMMWTRQYMPQVFEKIANTVRDESIDIAGMGELPFNPYETAAVLPQVAATSTAPASSSWVDTIKNIVSPLMNVYGQKKVLDLQLDRARAGQPPLDIANVQQYTGDTGVRFGVTSDTQRTVMIVAGIAGAALLGFALLRNRR